MLTDQKVQSFLGVEMSVSSYEEAAKEITRLSKTDTLSIVVTPNVDHIVFMHEGEGEIARQFRNAYNAAALRFCDSRILKVLAKFKRTELTVITGSDLTAYLFDQGCLNGSKVALVGGDQVTLDKLKICYPEIEIIQHIPPMKVLDAPEAVDEIELFISKACADFIFFAIGAPQSEIIAHRCQNSGRSSGVVLCVGASLEFLVGQKSRAPVWIQKIGFEWAYRLFKEPRRLWRRYLITAPRIFFIAASSQANEPN